jgi:lipopolysaccharide export LptBFGC system permease protein LptF
MTFLQRSLAAAGSLGAVAFVIAFAFRHSRHGVRALAGDIAWSSMLVAVLSLLILGAAALVMVIRGRRDDRSILR